MARGKHKAAAAARRVAAESEVVAELRAQLEGERMARTADAVRSKAELHESNVRWMAELNERVQSRFDDELQRHIEASAQTLFSNREAELKEDMARELGRWLEEQDVKAPGLSAWAGLIGRLGLKGDAADFLNPSGNVSTNRASRRTSPSKMRAIEDMNRQIEQAS